MNKTLLLLSNHLNQRYVLQDVDEVFVITTDEQFRLFLYHHTRIVMHHSAAVHFAHEQDITHLHESTYEIIANQLSTRQIYLYDPHDDEHKLRITTAFAAHELHILPDLNFFHHHPEALLSQPPYKLDPLYRQWRKQTNILMEQDTPVGGKYSFDSENRKAPPKSWNVPDPLVFTPDEITSRIIKQTQRQFPTHPKSKQPFMYPVTRSQSLALLNHFIVSRLDFFGDHQDAMIASEPWMAHSMLSASINLGLLFADEVVEQVEISDAPIAAKEGFIRQVLGWREYIRAIYKAQMPRYITHNYFTHQHPLPPSFYDAKTSMNCLSTTIQETIDHAYNHHIQRLMILGNITTLIGVDPLHVRRWFNEMYVDSFDWVVTPNVMGMASYADGGLMSTKPYVASANYINKMSNYCNGCKFDPTKKTGENACPVNVWYYDFLDRHQSLLSKNPRMVYMYANYRKLPLEMLEEIKTKAQMYRQEIIHGTL